MLLRWPSIYHASRHHVNRSAPPPVIPRNFPFIPFFNAAYSAMPCSAACRAHPLSCIKMIDSHTGDVSFSDGVCIRAHMMFMAHTPPKHQSRSLPIPGWQQHTLGFHTSDYGRFEVETTTDSAHHIEAAFLRHIHSFYVPGTTEDSERRIFHEGIIARDLRGQREFDWGHVFCRIDTGRDWLCLIYSPFTSVPLQTRAFLQSLHEHSPLP